MNWDDRRQPLSEQIVTPDPRAARPRRHAVARAARPVLSVLAVLLVLTGGALAAMAMVWGHLFSDMPDTPSPASLWAIGREPSIEILARDGTLIAHRGPSYARRMPVAEAPPHLVAAFLAAEDRRFYSHPGFDARAIVRAAWVNWRAGEAVQGGSTITQQLVKNLVVGPERTIRRKAQEARLAVALEHGLTKDEILELYLNRVYLGERAFGVEAASLRYFGKSARDVTLPEAALLAALPKAPTRLSPQANLAAARARAELVLRRMHDANFITREQMQASIETPAELVALPDAPPAPGYGYIFDEAARLARLAAPDSPDLVIRTTIDPAMQERAQAALTTVLDRDGGAARAGQGALIAMDYEGGILAMVGGRDYLDSQFNRAIQARRQPGSAFKPFVYAAAFEMGMRPATQRNDAPLTIGNWSPENFGGGYRGRMTLREAFYRSTNTVAARLGQEAGPRTVADMARRMGVRTELAAHPSIALGSAELTLQELTGAYAVFARDGAYIEPHLVTEIADTAGRVLFRRPETSPAQVYEARLARLMTGMMQDVVRSGTGTRAALSGRETAGKTGTSQDYRDAWFVGYTGNLITGVWVGNDDNSPMRQVTGGQIPATIWRDFMQAAERDYAAAPLNVPTAPVGSRHERLSALYSELAAAFSRAAVAP